MDGTDKTANEVSPRRSRLWIVDCPDRRAPPDRINRAGVSRYQWQSQPFPMLNVNAANLRVLSYTV